MNNKTMIVMVLFMILSFVLIGEIGYLDSKKASDGIKYYVKLTSFGDMVLYQDVSAVRFYSLESGDELWDDPVLIPRTDVDFIYRMHR